MSASFLILFFKFTFMYLFIAKLYGSFSAGWVAEQGSKKQCR